MSYITNEDRILLNRCIENDRYAQERLYKKHFPACLSMCRRYTQDEDQLISIINNGFLKVFQNMEKYQEVGSFEGWIKRIVFNSLSDYFRKVNKQPHVLPIEFALDTSWHHGSEEGSLEEYFIWINQLPKTTKEVFIKYAIEGYNHREIGELLSMAEGTSKWHLNQARTFLRQKVEYSKVSYKNG